VSTYKNHVDFVYSSPPIIAAPLPCPGNTHLRCKVVTWQPFLSRRCVIKCKRSARKKRKSSVVGLNWRAQSAPLAVVRRARRGKKIARRALLMCLRFARRGRLNLREGTRRLKEALPSLAALRCRVHLISRDNCAPAFAHLLAI